MLGELLTQSENPELLFPGRTERRTCRRERIPVTLQGMTQAWQNYHSDKG
jgi:hypothetical protein